MVEMKETQMGKAHPLEEYGVRGTHDIPEKGFRGAENLHGACMNKGGTPDGDSGVSDGT